MHFNSNKVIESWKDYDIDIRNFYYSNDIKALNDAFIANNLEELVSFSNPYESND